VCYIQNIGPISRAYKWCTGCKIETKKRQGVHMPNKVASRHPRLFPQ
jgi:hypothetical protein